MLSINRTKTSHLKLPPFGKILSAYQDQRVRLNFPIYIYVGHEAKFHCFEEIRNGSIASFLPEEESFQFYNWPIFNQHVILIDLGGPLLKEIQKMCLHLLNFKPRIVYFWSEDHPSQFFKGETNE